MLSISDETVGKIIARNIVIVDDFRQHRISCPFPFVKSPSKLNCEMWRLFSQKCFLEMNSTKTFLVEIFARENTQINDLTTAILFELETYEANV